MSDPYANLRGFQPVGWKLAEPVPIGKVLSELIALKGLARVQGVAQLQEAWRIVAGIEIATKSTVIGLSRGVLQIGVASQAMLSELAGFHKYELLKLMQTQHPHLKVKDLKFRLKTELR